MMKLYHEKEIEAERLETEKCRKQILVGTLGTGCVRVSLYKDPTINKGASVSTPQKNIKPIVRTNRAK